MTGSSKLIVDSALRAAAHLRSSRIPTEVAKSSAALFSAYGGAKHSLPDLKYDYGALEPAISAETMAIHHTKHHNTYVTNLNATLEKLDGAMTASDVSEIIALQGAMKFNGGGHLNHTLFWENMCPEKKAPSGALEKAITASFGDFESMKSEMSAKSVAVQGSGWGWLGYNKRTGLLEVATCANQDPLQATTGLVPIFGIDVWEHAYYVDYRNVRPDYVKATWDIIDWDVAGARLTAAQK